MEKKEVVKAQSSLRSSLASAPHQPWFQLQAAMLRCPSCLLRSICWFPWERNITPEMRHCFPLKTLGTETKESMLDLSQAWQPVAQGLVYMANYCVTNQGVNHQHTSLQHTVWTLLQCSERPGVWFSITNKLHTLYAVRTLYSLNRTNHLGTPRPLMSFVDMFRNQAVTSQKLSKWLSSYARVP